MVSLFRLCWVCFERKIFTFLAYSVYFWIKPTKYFYLYQTNPPPPRSHPLTPLFPLSLKLLVYNFWYLGRVSRLSSTGVSEFIYPSYTKRYLTHTHTHRSRDQFHLSIIGPNKHLSIHLLSYKPRFLSVLWVRLGWDFIWTEHCGQ